VPSDSVCEWYHITIERLEEDKNYEPREGWIVVDVGANVGLISIYWANLVGPKGKIISIEPDDQNYFFLVNNKAINNCDNLKPLKIAVADRAGKVKLFKGRNHIHYTIVKGMISTKKVLRATSVSSTTIDDLVRKFRLKRVDLLNIDAEGAELLILWGSRYSLSRRIIRRLKIECKPQNIVPVKEFLGQYSYNIRCRDQFIYASIF